jgi:tRNA(Ile)-lysidine synthase
MTRSVAVAVSGGRDSMALLHCLATAAGERDVEVWALHVHHGLMPQADEWASFVERSCVGWARKGLPLHFAMQRLSGRPAKGQSVEAWARAGRYAALGSMAREAGCEAVALAHHRGDQAETFLLQALRGAGAAGLAAMPARAERDGITWLRPWLDQSREAIEAYVRAHRIRFVDDASNADPRFARSRLRLQVMPALRKAFADAESVLAGAARQAAHARALIDEIAGADLAALRDGDALRLAPWLAMSPARRRASLRAWLDLHAEQGVADTLLERLCDELPASHAPARWPLPGGELRRYRGRLSVELARTAAASAAPWPCAAGVDRIGRHAVPGAAATLQVCADAAGLPLALLRGATWCARAGAERFQRAPGTPPRSLKKQFQAAGVPAWSRTAPLLFAADGTLLFVPGLGIDARAAAAPGLPRVGLAWQPQR